MPSPFVAGLPTLFLRTRSHYAPQSNSFAPSPSSSFCSYLVIYPCRLTVDACSGAGDDGGGATRSGGRGAMVKEILGVMLENVFRADIQVAIGAVLRLLV